MVTNGNRTNSASDQQTAQELRDSGVSITIIGENRNANMQQLQAMCSQPYQTHLMLVNEYAYISSTDQDLTSRLCDGK